MGGENPGGLNIPPGGGGGPPPGGGGAGGPPPGGGGGGGGPPPGGGGGGGGGIPPPGGGGGGGGGTDPPGNGGGGGGGIPEPGGGGGGGGPAPLAITEEICAPTPSLTCNEKQKHVSLTLIMAYSHRRLPLLTLKVPITTSHLLCPLMKCLRSLYDKQCRPRSNCSFRSSLI